MFVHSASGHFCVYPVKPEASLADQDLALHFAVALLGGEPPLAHKVVEEARVDVVYDDAAEVPRGLGAAVVVPDLTLQ